MTIFAQIGDSFESLLVEAPTGLVGEMGWKVIDPSDGREVIGHRTTGIIEPSEGTYFTTGTAPLVADQYLVVWDHLGVEVGEALVVTVAPVISARYATVTDLRNYTPLVEGLTDDQLNETLREAERWIDWYVPPAPALASGLKFAPLEMDPEMAIQLNYATCAQAEYILHMGPGFFISGSTRISGGDYEESGAPKVGQKAKQHLLIGGFVRLTGSVASNRSTSRERRFSEYDER